MCSKSSFSVNPLIEQNEHTLCTSSSFSWTVFWWEFRFLLYLVEKSQLSQLNTNADLEEA